jgi:hypothetical protein
VRSPAPVVIERLAQAIIAAAKSLGVKGRLRIIHKGAHYFLVTIVHAGETVSARSWSAPSKDEEPPV